MKDLNDFEIKAMGAEIGSNITKMEVSTLYNDDEIFYIELESKNIRLYTSIMVKSDEKRLGKLTPALKEIVRKEMKIMQEPYIDFHYHTIYNALDIKRALKEYREKYQNLYLELGPLKYSRALRKYLLDYTSKNTGALLSEVYNHCLENFIEDISKEQTIA